MEFQNQIKEADIFIPFYDDQTHIHDSQCKMRLFKSIHTQNHNCYY